jgi:uncharacterized protein YgbK (DUF1537 family)
MIAVIADDLTGAAEIAGIALRQGFRVVMDTKVHPNVDTDVLVIATDSRSMNVEEAKALTMQVAQSLLVMHPQLIFKKTDSLMRGHVGEELMTLMNAAGKKRALLIPANPALKRTIQNGIYYADNIPLNESDLADASQKRITTSGILELVGEKFRSDTQVISLENRLPKEGMIVGNTLTEADLDLWSQRLDVDTIPAGSGGFFNAVIKHLLTPTASNTQEELNIGKKVVYVCGSAFPRSRAFVSQARAEGRYVSYMPENIFCKNENQSEVIDRWIADILHGLHEQGKIIIAVDDLNCNDQADFPARIRELVALVIKKVTGDIRLDELVIEGGATAFSIIRKLGYERFSPVQEFAQGVIRMKVHENTGMFITMKPGSYHWPSSIWNLP